jgi:hypothetical protein
VRSPVRSLFWIVVSGLCYVGSCLESRRADRDGLRHTDPPCIRCARDLWEQRRIDALRKSRAA